MRSIQNIVPNKINVSVSGFSLKFVIAKFKFCLMGENGKVNFRIISFMNCTYARLLFIIFIFTFSFEPELFLMVHAEFIFFRIL